MRRASTRSIVPTLVERNRHRYVTIVALTGILVATAQRDPLLFAPAAIIAVLIGHIYATYHQHGLERLRRVLARSDGLTAILDAAGIDSTQHRRTAEQLGHPATAALVSTEAVAQACSAAAYRSPASTIEFELARRRQLGWSAFLSPGW